MGRSPMGMCSPSIVPHPTGWGCSPPDRLGLLDFKNKPRGQPHPAYRGRQTPNTPDGEGTDGEGTDGEEPDGDVFTLDCSPPDRFC